MIFLCGAEQREPRLPCIAAIPADAAAAITNSNTARFKTGPPCRNIMMRVASLPKRTKELL